MPTLRYAITDRTQYGETEPERRSGLIAQAQRIAVERIDFLQLREKDLPVQNLIGLTREIVSILRDSRSGTRLLINSRADVALAAGAHGVHLPSGLPSNDHQLTPSQIRALFDRAGAARPTVSVSCHTLAEVRRAREGGADLILFGPVFGKSVFGKSVFGKSGSGKAVDEKLVVPATGLEALRAACAEAGDAPVLALGSITAENSATTIAVGAAGFAAIRLFR